MDRRSLPPLAGMLLALKLGVTASCAAPPAKPQREARAEALLHRVRLATARVRTLSAEIVRSNNFRSATSDLRGEVLLQRPGQVELRLADPVGKPYEAVISTGKEVVLVSERARRFQQEPLQPGGFNLLGYLDPVTGGFMIPESIGAAGAVRVLPPETRDGRTYDVVERLPRARSVDGTPLEVTDRLYFGPSGLLEGYVSTVKTAPGKESITRTWLKKIRLNEKLDRQHFTFTPPEGFNEPEVALIPVAVGQPAPAFNLPRPGGGTLSLEDALRGKKAVLLNFWFERCGACQVEFPHLQRLYAELKEEGLEIVAVNRGDSEAIVSRYLAENHFTFPAVLSGPARKNPISQAYGVSLYPTSYLIGADGKVLWSQAGFERELPSSLREALAVAGIR